MNTDPIEAVPAGYYTSALPVVEDWGKVIAFTPELYFAPTSIEELTAFLDARLAETPLRPLRFVGGLHSCSPIYVTETVVDTQRLPLEFTIDEAPGGGSAQAVASGHMHAHDFLARAAAAGFSLSCSGGTDHQTMAGLISTNTAPATAFHGMYERLQWIDLLAPVDGTFTVRRIARGDPEFNLAVCSLGMMGYIVRVCFDLPPQLFFSAGFQVRPAADVLSDPWATARQHPFWRFEWIPDTDHGLFWFADPIDGSGVDPDGDYPADKAEGLLKLIERVDEKALKGGPFLNPLLRATYALMAATYGEVTAKGPMRHMIPCDRLAPVRVAQAEWGFEPADIGRVMDLCRDYFGKTHWPNTPIEIELCKCDPYAMSPWNWGDRPAIVKFNFQYLTDYLTDADKAAMTAHLRGLWQALRDAEILFKAHWGKINFLDHDFVRTRYGLDEFAPVIQPLFLNAAMKTVLAA